MATNTDSNNMFSAYGSIFDAATADNVGVRDRALSVAQLQPGRATVYGAHQAGGMLMQNLAGMAGMKTAEQQKAETINRIMKESQSLDPNDPKSARLLGQQFINAGLYGIGQKFIERGRTIDVRNQELALTERGVAARESDAAVNVKTQEQSEFEFGQTFALDEKKFGHLQWKDEQYIGLEAGSQELNQAKLDYTKVQDGILNGLRKGDLEISKARSALEQNDFEFRKARALVDDAQWKNDYDIKKLLADADVSYKKATTDNIILEGEAFTHNNDLNNLLTEATTAKLKAETDETIAKTIEDSLYGMSGAEQNVYNNLWDQYKQKFYKAGSIYDEGSWQVSEALTDKGLFVDGVPDFFDWVSEYGGDEAIKIVYKGQGGEKYIDELMRKDEQAMLGDNKVVTTSDVTGAPVVTEVKYEELANESNLSQQVLKSTPEKVNIGDESMDNTEGNTIGELITIAKSKGNDEMVKALIASVTKDKVVEPEVIKSNGISGVFQPWITAGTQEITDTNRYGIKSKR